MRESISVELRNLMRAKVGCIWLQTYEEEQAITDIRQMMREDTRLSTMQLRLWSNTSGLQIIPLSPHETIDPPDVTFREIPALFSVIKGCCSGEKESNNVFVLRDLHALIREPKTLRSIRDVKEWKHKAYNPIIVVSPQCEIPDDVAKLFRVVEYGLPDTEAVADVVRKMNRSIERIAKEHPDDGYATIDDDAVQKIASACVGLTMNEIEMMLRESTMKRKTIDLSMVIENKIQAVKKTGVLDYKVPAVGLDDIGGNRALKKWLNEVRASFSPEAREFGLEHPKGYMAIGIPGTSKTLMSEAFAGMMGWPILSLSMAKVMNRLVGESEKRIEAALDIVKSCAPCVFLIDECEKMLGSAVVSSNQCDAGVTARVFQSILKFMQDNEDVFVVMTSNDVSQLPPELTRAGRLDTTWYYGLPDARDRREIAGIHFAKFGRTLSDRQMDVAVDSTANFTGAEIQQAARNAMRIAFMRSRQDGNTELTTDDIEAGAREVVPLYKSSRERIMALETYCNGRARRTDGDPSEDIATALDDDVLEF